MKVSNLFKLFLFLFLFLGLAAFTCKAWLPSFGKCLLVKDNFEKADCIVPLCGDTYFRFKKAVELYDKSYANQIVLSVVVPKYENTMPEDYYYFDSRICGTKDLSAEEYVLKAFLYFGKDTDNIYFTGINSMSVYDEAVGARDFMLKKGYRSLIVVTSAYNARRAFLIFKWVFRNTGIKVYICTANDPRLNPGQWWHSERDVKQIMREYLSILHNFVYRALLKKGPSSFDTSS